MVLIVMNIDMQNVNLEPSLFRDSQRPVESKLLRWACRLLKVPGLTRYAKSMILKELGNCKNVDFTAGFKCMYGNVYAEDCSFNDAFLQDYSPIVIGPRTGFSYDCMLLTATHDLSNNFGYS